MNMNLSELKDIATEVITHAKVFVLDLPGRNTKEKLSSFIVSYQKNTYDEDCKNWVRDHMLKNLEDGYESDYDVSPKVLEILGMTPIQPKFVADELRYEINDIFVKIVDSEEKSFPAIKSIVLDPLESLGYSKTQIKETIEYFSSNPDFKYRNIIDLFSKGSKDEIKNFLGFLTKDGPRGF